MLALLPSVLFVDHWTEFLFHTNADEAAEAEEASNVTHKLHCHEGPATCADQPVPLNPKVVADLIEVREPRLPSVLVEDGERGLDEYIATLPTRPPRA